MRAMKIKNENLDAFKVLPLLTWEQRQSSTGQCDALMSFQYDFGAHFASKYECKDFAPYEKLLGQNEHASSKYTPDANIESYPSKAEEGKESKYQMNIKADL